MGIDTSVVVPMTLVSGVPVAVVHVVDVVTVRHGRVAAAFPVCVRVPGVLTVLTDLALIDVTLMFAVQMTVVHVVDMVLVRYRHMPAPLAMGVVVTGVRLVVRSCRHVDHLRALVVPCTAHGTLAPFLAHAREIAAKDTREFKHSASWN